MNALAVLYDLVPAKSAAAVLDRIIAPDKGIDAPEGMFTTSYYFSWYLVRAVEHLGQSERYLDLLATWRDLLKLNYTTWPEERGDTRSDTHAWSAHPTADLLGIVPGIQPAEPGYQSVSVKPALGKLTSLRAVAVTPKWPVEVSYRMVRQTMKARVTLPNDLTGQFHWHGKTLPLKSGRNDFLLSAPASEARH